MSIRFSKIFGIETAVKRQAFSWVKRAPAGLPVGRIEWNFRGYERLDPLMSLAVERVKPHNVPM